MKGRYSTARPPGKVQVTLSRLSRTNMIVELSSSPWSSLVSKDIDMNRLDQNLFEFHTTCTKGSRPNQNHQRPNRRAHDDHFLRRTRQKEGVRVISTPFEIPG